MSSAVAKIAKPQMRKLFEGTIKRDLYISLAATAVVGVAWRVLVYDERKQKFADFYKTYDPEAAFERLRKRGVFDSCPP